MRTRTSPTSTIGTRIEVISLSAHPAGSQRRTQASISASSSAGSSGRSR